MNNIHLWLWFLQKDLVNRKSKYQLLKDFCCIENIYNAKYEDYTQLDYLKTESIEQLCDKSCDYDELLKEYRQHNITLLTADMEEYPKRLLSTSEPPLMLYCRGKFLNLNKLLCIAVVGTRKMSAYGSSCAHGLSREMAERGAVIVSGMASGIDAKAHRGALDAGMPTVAVLGCGINIPYPRSNSRLMEEIMKTGMVISEYPPDTPPLRHQFPERNRIISGLSQATLVVEADIRSGSLITAKYSYEYGRDVFAVPGNIDTPFSRGTNYLIKDGAYLLDSCDDIMLTYELRYPEFTENGKRLGKKKSAPQAKTNTLAEKKQILNNAKISGTEDIILSVLKNDSLSIDEIFEITGIDMAALNSTLLIMELSGKINKLPGNRYTAS